MRWRVLAIASLGVNVVLAAVWLSTSRQGSSESLAATNTVSTPVTGGTNAAVRRMFFSWQEVESADYPTYIANLRYIDCPEQTIRDIIIADINALYARRRAMEVFTPEQEWWRTEPDTNLVALATEKVRALEDERRTLLTRLLGPDWESGDLLNLPRPSRPGIVLDGPLLGTLSTETKQSLQGISFRSDERIEAYLNAQKAEGKAADPVELAKLRQQTREELARVLAPPELEEYLLRYSHEADVLRQELGQLQHFNVSSNEFRALFRSIEGVDQQLLLLANSNDPNSLQTRRALEAQRLNAIKVALGTRRFEEYQLLHDPLYRSAVAAAQQAGTPEAARTIYQINLAAALSEDEIVLNPDLTEEQKQIEMKQLELDQLKANTVVTGRQLPPQPPLPPPPRPTYTLRPGDSPATIAMIYGVPESAIRAANPNTDFNRLRPGATINIPRNALPPAPAPVTSPMAR